MIYADNAATSRMSQKAYEAMLPFLRDNFGNPSSLHSVGQKAAEALAEARETVAGLLGCQAREIIFTYGYPRVWRPPPPARLRCRFREQAEALPQSHIFQAF